MARMTTPTHGKCSSCGATVHWARTVNGRAIPIDPYIYDDGNILLRGDGIAEVVKKADRKRYGWLWKSHYATCPHAAAHRKPRMK